MSWDLHQMTTGRALEDKVTIGSRRHRSGNGSTQWIAVLRIGRKIAERVGIAEGKIAVFWGSGKDAGWLRVDRTGPGRLTVRPTSTGSRSSYSIVLGPRADAHHEREVCEKIVIMDNRVDIKLPDWVRPPAPLAESSAKKPA